MSSSEDLIKRAKQMDLEVRFGPVQKEEDEIEALKRYIQVLESKINVLMERLDRMENAGQSGPNETQEKLMNMMWDWRSTSELAKMLGYRQEHVSRLVGEIKKSGTLQEKREGKNIFYKRL